MPRVTKTDSEEAPARAPRKRAPRTATAGRSTVSRATRSRSVAAEAERSARKAPTSVATSAGSANASYKKVYVALALAAVAGGGALFIGASDSGQIDVTARLQEQPQHATVINAETGEAETIEVQNVPIVPSSRLRRSEVQPDLSAPPTPPPVVAATTTEEGTGEAGETETGAEAEDTAAAVTTETSNAATEPTE